MYSLVALLALAGSVVAQNAACDAAYNTCRQPTNGVSANQAQCAAEYAACLGYNPFTGGVASSTGSMSRPAGTTGAGTAVVTKFTTVCPTPTTFVCDGSTYKVSSSTTLTITCPGGCAITTAPTYSAPTAPPAPTTTGTGTATATAKTTGSTPATYTGAADKMQVGGALLAAALGFMAL